MQNKVAVVIVDIEGRKEKLRNELKEKGAAIMLHFKGDRYKVFAISKHTETGEELVVYRCIYSNNPNADLETFWSRPIDMFVSPVDLEKYPNCQFDFRFMFLEDAQREMYQLLHGEGQQ